MSEKDICPYFKRMLGEDFVRCDAHPKKIIISKKLLLGFCLDQNHIKCTFYKSAIKKEKQD